MQRNWTYDDGGDYVHFIWRAAMDAKVFATFRRDPRYVAVVETLQPEIGRICLDLIVDPIVRQVCLEAGTADTIGGAITHPYDGVRLAPTTLRYGKILCDLIRLFPQFGLIEHIVEIGIGHGGQARMIAEYAARAAKSLKCYTCLDLLPVLHLTRQYLEHFALRPQFRFLSKLELPVDGHCDLAISNYAFSELSRSLQENYLDRVLLHAEAGYLTMNSGLWRGELQGCECLPVEMLLAKLPNAALLFEEPLTAPDNYVIVFGQHGAGGGASLDDVRSRARMRATQVTPKKERRNLFERLLPGHGR
jgi:hypothetical protein